MTKQLVKSQRSQGFLRAMVFCFACGVLMFGMHSRFARADLPRACSDLTIERGSGGEVPSPFSTLNQRVELANGEMYTLVGTVVPGPVKDGASSGKNHTDQVSEPYFQVDLKEHPWLANAARKADPTYPLDGGWAFWGKFNQKKIRITALAQATFVFTGYETEIRYVISLKQTDQVGVVTLDPPTVEPAPVDHRF